MKLQQRIMSCIAGLALASCAAEPQAQPERKVRFIPNYGACVRDVINDGTFKRVDSERMEAGFEEWRDELQQ